MEFINYFDDVEDVVGNVVEKMRENGLPVVLFGAGYCLPMFIDLCVTANINIFAIADNNKSGLAIQGITVLGWKELKNHGAFQILISTSHYEEIENQLVIEKFEGPVYHLPIQAYYKNAIYSLDYVKKEQFNLSKAYESFADDISRKVFINIIKHNISLNDCYYEQIHDLEIEGYFGTDLYVNRKDEIIVDAGAFDGDTIREFQKDPKRLYKKIYAFEPDKGNYELLKGNIINQEKDIPICAGLGEKCEILHFTMGAGVSSRIDDEGEESIQVESVDHFFVNEVPTFIKMDIEGAEEAALLGGKTIIEKYHPTLAVSAYHKKEDLFYLPKLIQRLGNNQYRCYLRHTFYYQRVKIQPDVIIYAIKEKENVENETINGISGTYT